MSDKTIEKLPNSSTNTKIEKSFQDNNILEEKQELTIEQNKLESDKNADIDAITQRENLALNIQKETYVKELNNSKPAVVNDLSSSKDIQSPENQESWFVRNKAWLIGAGGVGLGAWLLKPWKWFSNEKETKEDVDVSSSVEKKPDTSDDDKDITVNVDATNKKTWFERNRGWVFGGVAAAGTAYWFRDKVYNIPLIGPWLDGVFNPKLSFEDAMSVVEGNMGNAGEDHLKKAPKLEWDKDSKILKAFKQSFEIDIEKRRIKGLDITFKNYEDLITTIIIIASSKDHFGGKCAKDKPFSITSMGGDIEVALAQTGQQDAVTGQGYNVGTIAGGLTGATLGGLAGFYGLKSTTAGVAGMVSGGVAGSAAGNALLDHNDTLSQICPSLNDELSKKKLQAYLNDLGGWIAGKDQNIEKKGQTTDKKINTIFVKTLKKIENTRDENDDNNVDRGTERNASITNYNNRADVFELNAWGCVSYLQAKFDSSGKITSVTFEDSGVTFTGPKAIDQAIYLGLFVNQCEKELCGKGNTSEAFSYRFDISGNWDVGKGIYFTNDSWYNGLGSFIYSLKLSDTALEKNLSDLLEGKNMDTFIKWFNNRKSGGSSLWTNKSYKGRTNTYIEKLQKKLPLIKKIPTSKPKQAA